MTYSGNSGNNVQTSSQYVDSGTTPGSGAELLRDGSTFYDTALTRVEQGQRIDITEQIRLYHDLYGSSDNTQSEGLAASKSLNYAPAPTMQQAQPVKTTVYPFTFKLLGQVGLFGAENYYVRVDIDLLTPLNAEFEEEGWFPAVIEFGSPTVVNTYESEVINFDLDPPPPQNTQDLNDQNLCVDYEYRPNETTVLYRKNCYMPAVITNPIPRFWDPYVSVRLNDLGTGNIYIDDWLEPMLYTREREMWGYDKMYIRPKDFFYVGVHARNTRHLPYNIEVVVGEEYIQSETLTTSQKQQLIPINNPAEPVGQAPAAPAVLAVNYSSPSIYIRGTSNVKLSQFSLTQSGYTYYTFKSFSHDSLKSEATFQWDLYFGSQKINGSMDTPDGQTTQNLKAAFTSTGSYELRCTWTNKELPGGSATASIPINVT